MIVQHNMQALNASRMLNVTTGKQGKTTEKLSSGYQINRAADDAAGLSISEKMRRQIRGLDRASTNAQDGVSSVQTAEGALNEVHDMLQRMNELATQAANGTNSQTDRESIQAEISQLSTEIDRVSETTKFNETPLLKGGDGTKNVTLEPHDAGLKGELLNNEDGTASFTAELKVGENISIGKKQYTVVEDDGSIASNAAEIAAPISDLKTRDKVLVEYGGVMKGYEVTGDVATMTTDFVAPAPGKHYHFPAGGSLSDENNIATITYTDKLGQEQKYYMQSNGANWEQVVSFDEFTGLPNKSGTNLFDSTTKEVTDDFLNEVLRTASKIEVNKYGTDETVTFASAELIREDVEKSPIGSKISMTPVPGSDPQHCIGCAVNPSEDDRQYLSEPMTVTETDEVIPREDGTITLHDAKKLMAKELKQANSIGADFPDKVNVSRYDSGSDLAYTTAISAPGEVAVDSPMDGGEIRTTHYMTVSDMLRSSQADNGVGSNLQYALSSMAAAATVSGPSNNTIVKLTTPDGEVTNLRFAGGTAANPVWKNEADDKLLNDKDVQAAIHNASSIDVTWNSAYPEDDISNPTARYRTPEGMRRELATLNAEDSFNVSWGIPYYAPEVYTTGGIEVNNDPAPAGAEFGIRLGTVEVPDELTFNLHAGSDADLSNKINVDINAMNSKFLGINGLDVVGKDTEGRNIDDGGMAATYAIDAIEDAIGKINDQRSALGAIQNRLEHTINNLDNVVENSTAAESRIRDTDIAKEMVNYSLSNILTQAGQSMLAQANQSTQGALSLLGQ